MKISRLFSLIGVFLFVYILLNIDITNMLNILSKANILLLFLTLLTTALIVVMKAVKWKMLIDLYDKNPLKNSIKAWLMGFSLSMITPARVGDLSRAYHIKHKIDLSKGITTVIIDRVIDITILFCLAIIGFISFVVFLNQYSGFFLIISVFFALFLLSVYIFTKKELTKIFLKPIFNRFIPEKHKSKINITFHDFYSSLGHAKNHKKNIILAVILTIFTWLISIFQAFLLSMSIGLNVSYMFFLSIIPLIVLLDILPISISGIGTRDAAMILFLSFVSVEKEYAISLSFLILIFGYISVGLVGAVLLLKEHMK